MLYRSLSRLSINSRTKASTPQAKGVRYIIPLTSGYEAKVKALREVQAYIPENFSLERIGVFFSWFHGQCPVESKLLCSGL